VVGITIFDTFPSSPALLLSAPILTCVNHPKVLVACECCHVIVITDISLNRTAKRLERNTRQTLEMDVKRN
jgi:hypothetical protein